MAINPFVDSSRQHNLRSTSSANLSRKPHVPEPSSLCNWSLHIREVAYVPALSPEPNEDMIDPDNESSWKPWEQLGTIHDFADQLQENLESNHFSTIDVSELPISSGQIARAARRSPEQLLQDSFGFSIMARNKDLVDDMLEHLEERRKDPISSLHDLYPLHLASSYLDGSKTCCDLFHRILEGLPQGEGCENTVRKLYVNHLNHTVLDNLMIAILKAHSSCTPAIVDEAFREELRFAGEEVDICGRWDADSDCIRHLHASGNSRIPRN